MTSPDHVTPPSLPEEQFDAGLALVSRRDGATDDENRYRQEFIGQQLKHHSAGTSSNPFHFIQFALRNSHNHLEVNHVSLQEESPVTLAKLKGR